MNYFMIFFSKHVVAVGNIPVVVHIGVVSFINWCRSVAIKHLKKVITIIIIILLVQLKLKRMIHKAEICATRKLSEPSCCRNIIHIRTSGVLLNHGTEITSVGVQQRCRSTSRSSRTPTDWFRNPTCNSTAGSCCCGSRRESSGCNDRGIRDVWWLAAAAGGGGEAVVVAIRFIILRPIGGACHGLSIQMGLGEKWKEENILNLYTPFWVT